MTMNALPLARKYRPCDFTQMAGQAHVLETLSHALDHQRLHHAYLFTGTRGVGKTTLARILAKCLNCEANITSTPCHQCSHCQQISQGRHLDVIEIDAASRTKVEDTRELLDNIQYAPNEARFKIYIIDEVHMLSGHSFNALLKTLEEPPAHVKFILATTDPQKLPATILSRCLQFHLKNLSPEQIVQQLEYILKQENIAVNKTAQLNALKLIAKAAKGSLRDALSLLDQALSFTQLSLTEEKVASMLGYISEAHLHTLLSAAHTKNIDLLVKTTDTLSENGADFFLVLDELLSLLQQLALEHFLPSEKSAKHSQEALKLSPEEIQLYYQIALLGKRDLPFAPDPQSGFIMILLRLSAFSYNDAPKKNQKIDNTENTAPTTEQNTPTNHSSCEWSEKIPTLNLTGMTKLLAENAVLNHNPDTNRTELIIHKHYAGLLNTDTKQQLTQALSPHYPELTITTGEAPSETPFEKKERAQQETLLEAKNTVLSDKNIQSFMKTFSAKLESLSPLSSSLPLTSSTPEES